MKKPKGPIFQSPRSPNSLFNLEYIKLILKPDLDLPILIFGLFDLNPRLNLTNWSKSLISCFQFNWIKINFSQRFQFELTSSIYWFSVSNISNWTTKFRFNFIKFRIIGGRLSNSKFTEFWFLHFQGPKRKPVSKNQFFFSKQGALIVKISIIRDMRLPDKNTSFKNSLPATFGL